MDNEQIKELALANGFKLKEQPNGAMDLDPYVYEFYEFAASWLATQDDYVKSAMISAPLAQSRLYQIIDMQAEIDALKAQVAELKSKNTNYIVLSCSDLQAACDYGAPDKTDEQLETEMVIEFSENGHSGSGYYAYYADLPEEGSILLRNCGGKVEVQNG